MITRCFYWPVLSVLMFLYNYFVIWSWYVICLYIHFLYFLYFTYKLSNYTGMVHISLVSWSNQILTKNICVYVCVFCCCYLSVCMCFWTPPSLFIRTVYNAENISVDEAKRGRRRSIERPCSGGQCRPQGSLPLRLVADQVVQRHRGTCSRNQTVKRALSRKIQFLKEIGLKKCLPVNAARLYCTRLWIDTCFKKDVNSQLNL